MNTVWIADVDGSMTSAIEDLRLEVRDKGGMTRFLVMRQADPGTRSREILGSGSQPHKQSAMLAAETMAASIKRIGTGQYPY